MPVRTLLQGDIERYLDEERDAAQTLWFFVHIPKTAGSSFRRELAERLRPNANVDIDYLDNARSYEQKLDDAMAAFVARISGGTKFRFASGHVRWSVADTARAAGRKVKYLTMLRNPVSRVISDYRYQRTPVHPPHAAFIRQFPTIEDYIVTEAARDKIFKHLALDPKMPVEQVIENIESSMSFVGLTEMYFLSCRLLFTLLGEPRATPSIYERKTQALPENAVDDSPQLRAQIRELNRLDSAIYEHFLNRLRPLRETILKTLNDRSAQTEE